MSKWYINRDFPWKITKNRDFLVKNRQFQRFYRDLPSRLIVRFYRDKIVDFHLNLHIANIMRNYMISFIFSSHYISSSIFLRSEPLWLSYSHFFYRLHLLPFDSVLSLERETWRKRSRGGSCNVSLMSFTDFMKVLSFFMNVDFDAKSAKKSSVLAIYRDIISRLIGIINRDKIGDF